MAFGLAAALAAGGKSFMSRTPKGKGRGRRRKPLAPGGIKRGRPRTTSSGPKSGKPTRRVTDPTSRAAIRRSEERRGIRTTGPKPPTSRGPRKPSRTINTGPKRPRRLSSRTTRTAIARSRARLGRRR